MSLKVLHLISGGDTGGAKTHIFSLMEGLKDIADAKIICFIKDSFYEDALKEGINIEAIVQKRRSDMSVVSKIANIINKEKYDLVHCHGARANTIGLFLKSKIKVPMITTVHSDYLLDFKDNFIKNIIFTPINKIALKKFDYYVAVTDNFKDMLVSRGFDGRKIYTLYNGINMTDEPNYVSKEEFLSRYNLSEDGKLIVGQVARLDKVKNVGMMLKVAKELKHLENKIDFLIAGDGEEIEELKAERNEMSLSNVKFLGFVKDNYSMFNAIDINVLTSVSESFPYVILEAARMSVPTISTEVGGINELIRPGKDGFLVGVNDYKSMAEKIEYLYENQNLISEMGESINKRVKEKFSTKAMAEKQFEIYEDVIKRGVR